MQVQGLEVQSNVDGAVKKFGKNGYYKDKAVLIEEAATVFGDGVKLWLYEVNNLKFAHLLHGLLN